MKNFLACLFYFIVVVALGFTVGNVGLVSFIMLGPPLAIISIASLFLGSRSDRWCMLLGFGVVLPAVALGTFYDGARLASLRSARGEVAQVAQVYYHQHGRYPVANEPTVSRALSKTAWPHSLIYGTHRHGQGAVVTEVVYWPFCHEVTLLDRGTATTSLMD